MKVHWNQEELMSCCHKEVTAVKDMNCCFSSQRGILHGEMQNTDAKFCMQSISHTLPKLVNTELLQWNAQKPNEKKIGCS